MYYSGKSDVGMRRANNQDSFSVREYENGALVAAVCDGMGGALGGQTASRTALDSFMSVIDEFMDQVKESGRMPSSAKIAEKLRNAVSAANKEVYERSQDDPSLEGMGTTLVASLVMGSRIYTVNVGDSRMYLADTDKIVQITHDHSYVQYLVDIGKMTSEEAASSKNKNIITRAVGTEGEIESDVYITEVKKDRIGTGSIHILLCSDGLSNLVDKETIYGIIKDSSDGDASGTEKAVDELVETANRNGGSDNITAVIIGL